MEEQRPIPEVLQELLEAQRMSADKLAELTDVPKRFIASLIRGEFDQLPAKPYVRGYLFKIAEALAVDPHVLWQSYRQSADLAASGEQDRLPTNRFALQRVRSSRVIIALVAVIILSFAGFRFNDILGRPTIDLSVPESTTETIITVRGTISPRDRLTLNDEVIYPRESGEFEKEVQLEPGLNTLTFHVSRYLGRETTVIRQIFYQPVTEGSVTEEGD